MVTSLSWTQQDTGQPGWRAPELGAIDPVKGRGDGTVEEPRSGDTTDTVTWERTVWATNAVS